MEPVEEAKSHQSSVCISHLYTLLLARGTGGGSAMSTLHTLQSGESGQGDSGPTAVQPSWGLEQRGTSGQQCLQVPGALRQGTAWAEGDGRKEQ